MRLRPQRHSPESSRSQTKQLAFALLLVPSAVGCVSFDATSGDDQSVVGGRAESGYPAAVYLVRGGTREAMWGPQCGAVLIRPNVAVTAAHCIARSGSTHFGIGVGAANSGPAFPARTVVLHPDYQASQVFGIRHRHDVAVLILEDNVPDVPRVEIADITEGPARYVGYGRVTPGGIGVTEGYTGERRSAAETVTGVDEFAISATGVDGGLCWGDSGGPLLSEDGTKVFGVLSDFDRVFDCQVENQMLFTRLSQEVSFIEGAICEGAECGGGGGGGGGNNAGIVINEVATRGPGGASDEFIEIYNATDEAISLLGWGHRCQHVDSVAWGTAQQSTAFAEGLPLTAPADANDSLARVPNGHDSNDNQADFVTQVRSPGRGN